MVKIPVSQILGLTGQSIFEKLPKHKKNIKKSGLSIRFPFVKDVQNLMPEAIMNPAIILAAE